MANTTESIEELRKQELLRALRGESSIELTPEQQKARIERMKEKLKRVSDLIKEGKA